MFFSLEAFCRCPQVDIAYFKYLYEYYSFLGRQLSWRAESLWLENSVSTCSRMLIYKTGFPNHILFVNANLFRFSLRTLAWTYWKKVRKCFWACAWIHVPMVWIYYTQLTASRYASELLEYNTESSKQGFWC